ncbi:hypothetical protein [Brevundimonas lenta]|uniref:Uncharacterized protein n=1 Tax=Brevundimonas lenta TaxID=424796 RepID=A0A7W6JFC0_9CAUL|nr:hypothetical protein [Brevundimonas lenta]MBB4084041.1 hypothetical protein [Brevundimonas lenta]
MKIGQNASRTQAALVAAAALLAPASAFAGASDTYYERAFVVAADARCDLFQPQVGRALDAATAQARGAALRSGTSPADLAAVAARARARAGAVSCADPQLATVRDRVDGAFAGWARTSRMTFPGDRAHWVANRTGYARPTWRLHQTSAIGASPVAFGLAGKDQAASDLTAVVSWYGRPRPYAARIVLRDPSKLPRPWLAGDNLAPESARASLWATGVSTADATLLSDGKRDGDAWRFPASAAAALEKLDPRESFAIEFHFRDGSVATVPFEAGDFTAGRAFLAMGVL